MTAQLPSYEDAHDRSAPIAPFSNGTEGDAWTERWCDTCVNEADCPLILLSLMARAPAEWTLVHPGGLSDRYDCTIYEVADGEVNARG